MATEKYDLIVIGAGSAGLGSATVMNELGFRVLLIDKSPDHIGGDCLNTGCVPSKSLLRVAALVQNGREAGQFLREEPRLPVDWEKVKAFVRGRQDIIRQHENADWLRARGIELAFGEAVFHGRDSVAVNGTVYLGRKIIVATGSRPAVPDIPGLSSADWYTTDNIWELDCLPEKLLVIGGGPVGLELGQAFARLGSAVTLAEQNPGLLSHLPPAAGALLRQHLEKEGMEILTGCRQLSIKNSGSATSMTPGGARNIPFTHVLVAAGRTVDHTALRPERAGIRTKNGRMVVNHRLQTSNRKVFVLGDAAGGPQFSHLAELHVRRVLYNFFSPLKKRIRLDGFSSSVFTDPEVLVFGRQEEELRRRGIRYRVLETDYREDDRAITDNRQEGLLRLYLSRPRLPGRSPRLLGGFAIGHLAAETGQELVLALNARIPVRQLRERIYAYPVMARINRKPLMDNYRMNFGNRLKKLLKILYQV